MFSTSLFLKLIYYTTDDYKFKLQLTTLFVEIILL